jgi:hypothetical protein
MRAAPDFLFVQKVWTKISVYAYPGFQARQTTNGHSTNIFSAHPEPVEGFDPFLAPMHDPLAYRPRSRLATGFFYFMY